jgi:hypothetical protein
MTAEYRTFKNELLDKLFLAAAQNPASVRAMLKIEKVDSSEGVETEFLVNGRVMTLLHDLLQAVEDDASDPTL